MVTNYSITVTPNDGGRSLTVTVPNQPSTTPTPYSVALTGLASGTTYTVTQTYVVDDDDPNTAPAPEVFNVGIPSETFVTSKLADNVWCIPSSSRHWHPLSTPHPKYPVLMSL